MFGIPSPFCLQGGPSREPAQVLVPLAVPSVASRGGGMLPVGLGNLTEGVDLGFLNPDQG